jgi:hypothetical protein
MGKNNNFVDIEEYKQTLKEAISDCDKWRKHYKITDATPNQLHLYNIFTSAKGQLSSHLACIEDFGKTYMTEGKE